MRFLSRTLAAALIAGPMLLSAEPARAAETASSEFVIVQPDAVLDDDLYAAGVKVSIEGRIEGDLIAFAGEEVVIDGTVAGSVMVVAPRVTVNGSVGESLRAVTGALSVDGDIGRDIVATAYEVTIGETSSVAGDVLVWAWDVTALGSISGDLTGTQRSLELAGSVEGQVDVSVGQLSVVGDLEVGGDFGYRSSNEATGLEQMEVGGTTVRKTPLPPNLRVRALGLFGRFILVLFLTIGALAVAYGWPGRTLGAIEAIRRSPIRAWLSGALVMLLPAFLAGLAVLLFALGPPTAAFPLLAVLGPLVLAALGLVLALSLVAGVPSVGGLGLRLFPKLELYGAIVAGSALTGLIWLLPWVGWLVPLSVLPLGLGGWLLGFDAAATPASEAAEEPSPAT